MRKTRDNIKMKVKFYKKEERGSITVFVLTSLLFMIFFVMIAYSNISNKKILIRKDIEKIKNEYGNPEMIQQEMEEEYNSIVNKK